MGNFKDKLKDFMSCRYGADQLYLALLVTSLVFMVVNAFIRSPVIEIFIWVPLIWAIFRSFSRNVYKRQAENDKFMEIWNRVKAKCSLTFRRIREIRTHRFRRCPHCKAQLRLPRKRGRHTVQCPRCHEDFDVRIL